MRALGVIPARLQSTRFPGKPLALIGGRPMVLRVWDHAVRVPALDRVVIATDSKKIARACEVAGADVILTPAADSGTDRVAWVYRYLGESRDVYDRVINIQGDEPFLEPEAMGAALGALECGADMSTLACFLEPREQADIHVVKVLISPDGRGIDFSREYKDPAHEGKWLKHIGMYGFRGQYLEHFVELTPSVRERRERLEQLRALEDGAWIQVVLGGDWSTLAVDTPKDLLRAEERFHSAAGAA